LFFDREALFHTVSYLQGKNPDDLTGHVFRNGALLYAIHYGRN
jgi:hypothetical protein